MAAGVDDADAADADDAAADLATAAAESIEVRKTRPALRSWSELIGTTVADPPVTLNLRNA